MRSAFFFAVLFPLGLVACGRSGRGQAAGNDGGFSSGGSDAGPGGGVPGAGPDGGLPGTSPDGGLPGGGTGLRQNPIPLENALPGTTAWRLDRPSFTGQIEGYAHRQSVAAGEPVDVSVTVPGGGSFSWFLYRLGYYGGQGGREVARGGPLAAPAQPACSPQPITGLVACNWPGTFTIATDPGWTEGAYVVKLQRADGLQRYVPLVIRDPSRVSEVLAVIPTSTWQAYNTWGGTSLYDDLVGITGRGRAWEVSYDRPYVRDVGAGHLFTYERSLIAWIESRGVDVAYLTDEDLDRDPSPISTARAAIVSGHDEYWSAGVRAAFDGALAGGTSVLLFGANAAYWQVRYAPAADGRDRRVVVCYKGDAPRSDPVGPQSPLLTVQFRQPPVNHPESLLFGVQLQAFTDFGVAAPVVNTGHWVFDGTGLFAGDTLPLVGGYEADGVGPSGLLPGEVLLTHTPFLGLLGGFATGQMAVRPVGNAWVFAAGGIDFVRGLGHDDAADPRVQRIADNVLFRALGRAPPANRPSFAGPTSTTQGPVASSVTTFAGTDGQPGTADGPRGTGELTLPVGLAALPGTRLAISDAATGQVRVADGSGALTTLPGPMLVSPMGLAADETGNIYVADTGNAAVWQISPAGTWSVLAGQPGAFGNADGSGSAARFLSPAGMAAAGTLLYVADVAAGAIRTVDLADPLHAVKTLPASPQLYHPTAVAVAPDGTVYVVETGMIRVVALQGGSVMPVAGSSTAGYRDGPALSGRLLPQFGIAVLPDGSVVVSDGGNERLRRVVGGQLTTWAGDGSAGSTAGEGASAAMSFPSGLAPAPGGGVYVAASGSATVRLVLP